MAQSNIRKLLGPKGLAGSGNSRIPTTFRRELLRTTSVESRADARERIVNEVRGVGERKFKNEQELRQERVRRLEEFKAKRAKQKLEEIRSKRKPFVCGVARCAPYESPKPNPNSSRIVLNISSTPKLREVQRVGSSTPAENLPIRSKIPKLPVQGAKGATSIPSITLNEPGAKVEEMDATKTNPPTGTELNNTYDVLPEAGNASKNGAPDQEEKDVVAKVMHEPKIIPDVVMKSTLSSDVTAETVPIEKGVELSRQNESKHFTEEVPSAWNPEATSSPFTENQPTGENNRRSWCHGIDSTFTFKLNAVVDTKSPLKLYQPQIAVTPVEHCVATAPKRDDDHVGDTTTFTMTVSINGATVSEVSSNIDGNGETETCIGTMDNLDSTVTESVRRSSRSTRYTGSFKGMDKTGTPRRRRSPSLKRDTPKTTVASGLTASAFRKCISGDEIGISEVRSPDSWLYSGDSSNTTVNITTNMASLSISPVSADPSLIGAAKREGPDNEEEYFTASMEPLLSQHSKPRRQRSLSDSDTSLLSPSTDTISTKASLLTPVSILRRANIGTSTQKKQVRFRTNSVCLSPEDQHDATFTVTPAKDVVSGYRPRCSMALRRQPDDQDDMIQWN